MAVISPSKSSAEEIRQIVFPELEKKGFVEGRNLAITMHVGASEELSRLGREAVATNPDVVIASTNASVRAILEHSKSVAIVMAFAGEDPVATGLAQSLSRPGGSVTGLTNQAYQLDAKNVSLLHEVAPAARRFGVVAAPPPRHFDSLKEMRRIGAQHGLVVEPFYAIAPSEYRAAFSAMRTSKMEAVAFAAAPEYTRDGVILAQLALEAGLPTIGEATSMARDGLLMSYGAARVVFRRRAADFVARILNGTPPGDLAIEQPTAFEFAINLKTAKTLGLSISPIMLAQADVVIE